jgi:transposase
MLQTKHTKGRTAMKKIIGMDLGDKKNVMVVLDETGKEIEVSSCINTAKNIQKYFSRYKDCVVVMEAGTHSAWIGRSLTKMGHEVHVGNPRKLRAIWDTDDKSDTRDARVLALMYRLEPRLLHEVFHRSEEAQMDLELIKARNQLVESRSKLINHVRGAVKGVGQRLSKCSAECFARRARECLPGNLKASLSSMLDVIEHLTEQIRLQDRRIEEISIKKYPETKYLRQVPGVGPITALAFVLTLETPERFGKSRVAGAFLGLTPRRDQSGDTDKQLRITKAGNTYMRQLLISCAHYILGPFGPDSDLRFYGQRIAARGGKNAKKRAVVAVARKLAVLLHRLWITKDTYVAIGFKDSNVA